jgi:hypothetical protein
MACFVHKGNWNGQVITAFCYLAFESVYSFTSYLAKFIANCYHLIFFLISEFQSSCECSNVVHTYSFVYICIHQVCLEQVYRFYCNAWHDNTLVCCGPVHVKSIELLELVTQRETFYRLYWGQQRTDSLVVETGKLFVWTYALVV